MTPDSNRHDLLDPSFSTWAIALIALALIGAWAAAHWFRRVFPDLGKAGQWPWFGMRVVIGSFAIFFCWQWLARFEHVFLATSWSLWFSAILGGLAIETIWWLYGLEKKLLPIGRGRLFLGLRLGATIVMLFILVEPVFTRIADREINREVVIMVDDSDSMQLTDEQQGISEQLAIASLFEPDLVADRPQLKAAIRQAGRLQAELTQQIEALAIPEGADNAMVDTVIEQRAERIREFSESAKEESEELVAVIEKAAQTRGIDGGTRNSLNDIARRLREQMNRNLEEAVRQVEAENHAAIVVQLKSAGDQLGYALQQLPGAMRNLDEAFYQGLSTEQKGKIILAAERERVEIAKQLLKREDENGETIYDRLRKKYNVRFVRFGIEPGDFDGEAWLEGENEFPNDAQAANFRAQTDLATALEDTLDKVSAESLAGVLLLSDGRHNAELPVEDAARQMGAQGSPICAIPIGSRIGPKDASLLSLGAPESIYLGDRIAIKTEVKLDGMRGQAARVNLIFNGERVDQQVINVPDQQYRTELRFVHTPEAKGIFDYSLEIEPIEGELFSNNNSWDFKCAVTDDRTNVLIVDSFPRWEFRYLRNLFYGRDKSVHLQYVLLNPDEITMHPRLQRIHASAARDFGDAEATHLPENASEWRKFDAIIIGDIPPAAIDEYTWDVIRECVAERGAMLVMSAGRRYMPHAFDNEIVADLLPVKWTPGVIEENPEEFRFELTSAGSSNLILQQSLSRSINKQIWGSIPPLAWRFQPEAVKESAEVLAYAIKQSDQGTLDLNFSGDPNDVEAALEKLARRKEYEKENALLITQRFGLGRVVMLNFDGTWRFRYGVGDTYHHKFWGQMMRWGCGENLRSGGEFVRLGTDQLSYTPNSPVKVVARVLDTDRQPVTGGKVYARLYDGDQQLQRLQLSYREGSNGIFEGELDAISKEGEYRLELEGGPVERAMNESGLNSVETELIVVNTRSAIELSELTADHDFMAQTAQLARGAVASVDDADSLVSMFGAAKEILKERRDTRLWDKLPLLLLFVGLVTTEWILRRRSGLA